MKDSNRWRRLSPENRARMNESAKARQRAHYLLARRYPDEFRELLFEERLARGLPPEGGDRGPKAGSQRP